MPAALLLLSKVIAGVVEPSSQCLVLLAPDATHASFVDELPVHLTLAKSFNIGDHFRAGLIRNCSDASRDYLGGMASIQAAEYNQIATASKLGSHWDVARPNKSRDAEQKSPPSWGLERISKRHLPLPNEFTYPDSAGEDVDVYVADTGIYIEHEDFGGRATHGFVAEDVDEEGSADCNGHGTHVAGTVGGDKYGVAKKVNLIAVKVLGCSGSGNYDGIIAGLDWVVKQHEANSDKNSVVNLSLGGDQSVVLNAAVDAVAGAGVHVAAAAGNDRFQDACTKSPASAASALTVAAATIRDDPAAFTNLGECVDVWAPGEDITSAWIG